MVILGMTRWKRGVTEFTVSVHKRANRDGSPDRTCKLPGPVAKRLGDPGRLKFVVSENGRVFVEAGRVRVSGLVRQDGTQSTSTNLTSRKKTRGLKITDAHDAPVAHRRQLRSPILRRH